MSPHEIVTTDPIVYRTIDQTTLTLEVDQPKVEEPTPVMVWVHSYSGTSGQLRRYSQRLARHKGIAGVRINYRKVADGATLEETLSDVAAALAFVRSNAATYGFDVERLGIGGASAGAVIGSIAAQREPHCRVFVAFNGGFDWVEPGESRFLENDRVIGTFLGAPTEGRKKAASAIHQLRDDPPDAILYHGTADETIDCNQPVRFADAVRAKGSRAEVKLFDGREHGFFHPGKPDFEAIAEHLESLLPQWIEGR